MPYLMGGYPDLETSRRIGEAYADAGADIVELGVPFSDPLADGPVIHAAATAALAAGATMGAVLDQVLAPLARRLPVVVMCYVNVLLARGVERSVHLLADAGASGLIVPDLPLEETDEARAACAAHGLALVPLVAPTTPDDRLRAIGRSAQGFVYAVSVTGTTGERSAANGGMDALISRAAASTAVPVALGFGIGTPERAAAAADAGAAGVIVGSRLVRAVGESPDPAAAVGDLVRGFATALTTP
jgi:tryptophan synthase alpha chain